MARKKINEVFTPRSHDVNEKMYVERPGLEKSLKQAIEGSQHVLLCGESGNGKSWLYKKVFYGNFHYVAANCANAARNSSITKEIERISITAGSAEKQSFTETSGADVNAVFAKANINHSNSYAVRQKEPLLAAFESLSKNGAKEQTIIVLENLESIFSSSTLMDEMGQIILLLDDPGYAKHNIKFLIVGTPTGAIEYFSKTETLESVANRISELPKVGGLIESQVREIVAKGFVSALQVRISDDDAFLLANHIFTITMGVAQRVHEYCEQLAMIIENNNWSYNRGLTEKADKEWLIRGLRKSYSVLEQKLNNREAAVARRNQVIFSIGLVKTHQFDASEIELLVRKEFPDTASGKNLGVRPILTALCSGSDPLLARSEKTNHYRVKDPRYIMCIRTVLYKSKQDGKVKKKNFLAG